MLTDQVKKQVLQRYVDCWNADDVEGVLALYADEATAEDPVGTEAAVGIEAIRAKMLPGKGQVIRITLDGPIRTTYTNRAAMAFTLDCWFGEEAKRVKVIDVISFDDHGKILALEAHWGDDDIMPLPADQH
ncbi:nuclear transport factor 2 family protein [Streptomyces sp. NPDC051684]|uniref:nuclear transport factor 2 family protein n=1 Tax=Streptomyces sp. NPDC051684 TaxID=3365670 RepID=UPI00378C248B